MRPIRRSLPIRPFVPFAIAALALLLTACGTLPGADQDDAPGNDSARLERIEGVVDRVDLANRAIEVTANRDSRVAPGQRVSLNYDDLTNVTYEGRDYRPEDLEPGDRIIADVRGQAPFFEARIIAVTVDSSPDDLPDIASDDGLVTGTLRAIDTRNRTLTVDTGSRAHEAVISFDSRTRVLYGNRSIAITELREFDELEIELVPGARNQLADTVTVVDSGYAADSGAESATARGEVVLVDESRRELVITADDRFPSSFDTGSSFDTRKDERATFRYDPNVIVEYEGEYYGPSNLDRGDRVAIDYERIGDDLWAKRILVTASVRH
jgi:hypothetical protein